MTTLVFAYGSNMHRPQMRSRCPSSRFLGPALLRNYRLGFASFSRRWNGAVATIHQSPGKRCYGLLYELGARDLELLDGYEGTPTIYERITVPVFTAERTRRVHTYRLRDTTPGYPSAAYLDLISNAYRAWGFDAQGLVEALEEGCQGKDYLRPAHAIALRMISA